MVEIAVGLSLLFWVLTFLMINIGKGLIDIALVVVVEFLARFR